MPFTPLHMGAGLCIKAVAQRRFSLMVFGWTQIVMDLQPLLAMLTGRGELHGFTHTYLGATLVAVVAALTGKPLGQLGLRLLRLPRFLPIGWGVAALSALVGAWSHVAIDSLMHAEMHPWAPWRQGNTWSGLVSIEALQWWCLGAALLGSVLYFVVARLRGGTPWKDLFE